MSSDQHTSVHTNKEGCITASGGAARRAAEPQAERSSVPLVAALNPDPRYQGLPITEKSEGFKLIKQLYDQTHFVEHQISTYNDFITRGVQAIVNKEPRSTIYE